MTKSRYQQCAGLCAIISIGFAATLGPLPFLTITILILWTLIYHSFAKAPSRVSESLVSGLAGVFLYLAGFLTTTTVIKDGLLVLEPLEVRYPDHGPVSFSAADVVLGICIFFIVSFIWFYWERNTKEKKHAQRRIS